MLIRKKCCSSNSKNFSLPFKFNPQWCCFPNKSSIEDNIFFCGLFLVQTDLQAKTSRIRKKNSKNITKKKQKYTRKNETKSLIFQGYPKQIKDTVKTPSLSFLSCLFYCSSAIYLLTLKSAPFLCASCWP